VLLRMRKEGWLDSQRTGREARYRLAPAINSAQARIESQLRGKRPPWEGFFWGLLYEVPEHDRAYRDRLRRAAQLLGYATLRPGLLVATSDRWAELTGLVPDSPPPGSQLLRVQIRLDEADSRLVAPRLWGLAALAARYRKVLAESGALTDQADRHPAGPAAFRAFADATLPIFDATAVDPDLPDELLPDDWPGAELGIALSRAFIAFHPLIAGYLQALTG
jgi:phenylacetic acid degradation operon negative regulatory protein